MLGLAIIGAGPAALTAAIYAARAGLKVRVYDKKSFGGALNDIIKIENFPGFVGEGSELARALKNQAIRAGAEIEYGDCSSVEPLIVDGEEVEARVVLIATGSEPRPLGFQIKKPVSYCVLCDAPLYKGKNVAVVGGGNSAVQESLHLAKIVKKLTLISHTPLRAEKNLIEKLQKLPNVGIRENAEPTPSLLNDFDAVFVLIGKRPATTFLPKDILSSDGYIVPKNGHQTAHKNLFVAGDVRQDSIRQAITAAADGAAAALEIIEFLNQK